VNIEFDCNKRDKKNMGSIKRLVWVLVSLVLLSAAGYGQGTKGAVRGTVTDGQGAVMAGVTVTVVRHGSDQRLTTNTDQEGRFEFKDLDPGIYDFKFEGRGFAAKVVHDVQVSIGQAASLNIVFGGGDVPPPPSANCRISGTVLTAAGTPARGAVVEAKDPSGATRSTRADSSGKYSLSRLKAGEIKIWVAESAEYRKSNIETLDLQAHETRRNVDLTVQTKH